MHGFIAKNAPKSEPLCGMSDVLLIPGQWPVVLNLTEEHQHLLRILGKPYMGSYRSLILEVHFQELKV
jgi:hypothetical protein